ncbi:MAG: Calvin cycle protein CP12 [Cyanobacteria bacterium]|nr:Calvin cycle protein CP12 [Cyanobacteriota bacterium]MDA0867137.1 Calvin cycle protein CP12 [Cyanobacteriota bacterium]
MTQATTAPSLSTSPNAPMASVGSIPTKPTSTLDTALLVAFEHARRLTDIYGTTVIDVAIAWETVEELQVAKARRQTPAKSAFARYCEAHPDAPEARIYDL